MVAWPNAWCALTRQTTHTRNAEKSQNLWVSGLLVGRSSRSEGELRKLAASYLGRNLGGFYSSRKSTTTFFPSDGQPGSYRFGGRVSTDLVKLPASRLLGTQPLLLVRLARWSQWIDATLSSNPTCSENKG